MKLVWIFVLNDSVLRTETFCTANTTIVMSFGGLQIILYVSFYDAARIKFRNLHCLHVKFTQIFIWYHFILFYSLILLQFFLLYFKFSLTIIYFHIVFYLKSFYLILVLFLLILNVINFNPSCLRPSLLNPKNINFIFIVSINFNLISLSASK